MRLSSFNIKNFRSIINTGWRNLSEDNITVLIGQNESGKSSVLEALYSFYTGKIHDDFIRSDDSLPEVSCSFALDKNNLEDLLTGDVTIPQKVLAELKKKGRINISRSWNKDKSSELRLEESDIDALYEYEESLVQSDSLQDNLSSLPKDTQPSSVSINEDTLQEKPVVMQNTKPKLLSKGEFINRVMEKIPVFDFFEDFGSLLPDMIDLDDIQSNNTKVEGYKGARNFLTIAGFDLNLLSSGNLRIIENKIESLNKTITADFQEFWRQKIGKTNKICIEFELKNHPAGPKAGKPYLVFWVKDGQEKLFPKQRSKGVRWFLSFYLQLKAIKKEKDHSGQILLIDEPGGSLHARAQEDVLKVFEDIKDAVQVVYTTHSPHLISLETLYRILAAQRADQDDDKSETLILTSHELGAASQDTLSPIYTLMGSDFSQQQVIKKKDNIILEEISAFYYISAFWKLTDEKHSVYFLPATGVDNIPQLANLLLGWGIDFGILVDGDKAGLRIFQELKKNLFNDDPSIASKKLYSLNAMDGIEDIFSQQDFRQHILQEGSITYTGSNSEYMKQSQRSKAVYAYKFKVAVENGTLNFNQLGPQTQKNISNLVNKLVSLV